MALLNEINVKGVPHPIVTDDGYYEEMTVGDAEQLISTQFLEDNKPYLFRPTGGSSDVGNRAYLDKIVGGTVAWNQMVDYSRRETWANNYSVDGTKITSTSDREFVTMCIVFGIDKIVANHKYMYIIRNPIYSYNGSGALKRWNVILYNNWQVVGNNLIYGNSLTSLKGIIATSSDGTESTLRLFVSVEFTSNTAIGDTFSAEDIQLFDLTQMFGTAIADYIYSLEQSQAGAGVAWFKKLFPKDYYPYNAGELMSVEGLQSHDTVGFNQWDEEWEVGSYGSDGLPIVSDDKIRTKNRISVKPSTAYYFNIGGSINLIIFWYDDNDTVISYEVANNSVKTSPANAKYLRFRTNNYGTTYKNDICVNLSDPSRNGEYEPYEKRSYPLDNSLTLRGIPKLDASNNLYYDGDEYTSDGKVKRKCAEYTLTGNEGWKYYATDDYFYCNIALGAMPSNDNNYQTAVFVGYTQKSSLDDASNRTNLSFTLNSSAHSANNLYVRDTSFNGDLNAFKSHIAGKKIVFLLATPTTEEAEPYQHIQIVDDFGTEEFVSTGIIPAGHVTRYPANLRDKLQHLPDLAGMDGTYLIKQMGKQMSLIHMPAVFPDTPTEDGTYTLKVTVSGGTPTYVWADVNAESKGE